MRLILHILKNIQVLTGLIFPPSPSPTSGLGGPIPIYTNDTVALGGFSDKRIIPNQVNFSYHGVFDRYLFVCLDILIQ